MTTLTGPGKAELPWDEEHCAHRGPHRHRGPDGCRVLPLIAQQWNATAAARLSQLHKAAHQRTYRKYGKWSGRLAYGPEVHARGVVHWHIVVAFGTPFERRTGRFYIAQLHDLAATYDYGYVDRKVGRAAAGIAAASYISKYLTGDKGPKGLRALVLSGQAPERAVGVHRALTTCTRVTMRNLRLRRACWMLFRVRLDCSEAETIWAICRAFPGTELILPASDPSAEP
jgi:hypothetical protein